MPAKLLLKEIYHTCSKMLTTSVEGKRNSENVASSKKTSATHWWPCSLARWACRFTDATKQTSIIQITFASYSVTRSIHFPGATIGIDWNEMQRSNDAMMICRGELYINSSDGDWKSRIITPVASYLPRHEDDLRQVTHATHPHAQHRM